MGIIDGVAVVLRTIKRWMREAPTDSVQHMAPERPMSLSKPKPKATLPEPVGRPRPWAESGPNAVSLSQEPNTRMERLAERLRAPETLRDSIIIKEILDRPLARRRR